MEQNQMKVGAKTEDPNERIKVFIDTLSPEERAFALEYLETEPAAEAAAEGTIELGPLRGDSDEEDFDEYA